MALGHPGDRPDGEGMRVIRCSYGDRIILRGGYVVGGGPGPVDVFMEQGYISDIRPANTRAADGWLTVDANGLWLIPGLIDCHVHLTGERTYDPYKRYLDPSRDVRVLSAAADAEAYLHCGFTSLREVGPGFGSAIEQARQLGVVRAPRVLASRCALTTTGGHGDWAVFPMEWANTLRDRGTIADGVDEVRKAVRLAHREGADLVKVMVTSGGITNFLADFQVTVDFSQDELAAIVDEASRRRLRVAAHSVGPDGARACIAAGVNTIEHGVFEPDPMILDAMAGADISLIPTMSIFSWVAQHGKDVGVLDEGIEAAKVGLERQIRLVAAARSHGVKLAFGTDSHRPGPNVRAMEEIRLLAQAGLNSQEILTLATRDSARACGMEQRLGMIAPGYLADILALNQNPVEQLDSLANPQSVEAIVIATVEFRDQTGFWRSGEKRETGV